MNLLGLSRLELEDISQAKVISPQNNVITIDQIRQIRDFTKLKTLGTSSLRRAIVIENAEKMGNEAQNALLKLLEEPPADTIIILTSENYNELLPTINSRSQMIKVQNPDRQAVVRFFEKSGKQNVEKAYHIAEGRIGLINDVLTGKSTELTELISLAKQVLGMEQFDRLKQVDLLGKDKANTNLFLQAMEITCSAGLKQAITKNISGQIKRWHNCLKLVLDAQTKLTIQANTKLLLTNLMLSL